MPRDGDRGAGEDPVDSELNKLLVQIHDLQSSNFGNLDKYKSKLKRVLYGLLCK